MLYVRSCDPVPSSVWPFLCRRGRTGGGVVRLQLDDADFVGAVRTVRGIQFFENTSCVVTPARTTPRGRKVKDHLISGIEIRWLLCSTPLMSVVVKSGAMLPSGSWACPF